MLKRVIWYIIASVVFVSSDAFSYKIFFYNGDIDPDYKERNREHKIRVTVNLLGRHPEDFEPQESGLDTLKEEELEFDFGQIPPEATSHMVYDNKGHVWSQKEIDSFLEGALQSGKLIDRQDIEDDGLYEKAMMQQLYAKYKNGELFTIFPCMRGGCVSVQVEEHRLNGISGIPCLRALNLHCEIYIAFYRSSPGMLRSAMNIIWKA